MKPCVPLAGVLALTLSGAAVADCTSGTLLGRNDAADALRGSTVCAAVGSDRWQEYHAASGGARQGALIDYKKGPSDPVDPTKQVGTWRVTGTGSNGTATVTYDYGTGGAYSYQLRRNGAVGSSSYSFCGAINIDATLLAGQVACP